MTNTKKENHSSVLRVFQTKEETKAFYNKIASVYDMLSEYAERPIREKGLELLATTPGEHILEIGFGTGHCLVEITKAVGQEGKAYGIDLADKMVEQTRALLQKEGLLDWVELYYGDAIDLPWENDSMHGVFMSFTLELFDTPEIPKVLEECKRVLIPGGRIVVVGISKKGKQGVVIKAFEWTHRHFPNLMDCRPIFVQKSLEEAGFQIEATLHEHMWVPVEIVRATI